MAAIRFSGGGILASLLAGCLLVPAAAQLIPDQTRLVRPEVRLISPEEGEAIVQTVWELRRGLLPKPDCSHFVHVIYTHAGFAYGYAQAADLFDGIASFRRVKKPQPGDLVVWQGHAGIVVDPSEHSFYSSVAKGFALEDYRSSYWAARGAPRFYRYLADDAHGAQPPSPIFINPPVPTTDLQSDSIEALDLHDVSPAADAIDSASSDTETREAVFVSPRKKPSKDEVLAAIVHWVDANSNRFLRSDRLETQPLVIVAEGFTVAGLSIKGNSGWVDLNVKQAASLRYGKADLSRATDTWRVELSRQEQGWIVLVRQDHIYLNRSAAVKVLARLLAAVSREPANQDLKKVVRILNQLLLESPTSEGAGGGGK
jgi:hypothetical protein